MLRVNAHKNKLIFVCSFYSDTRNTSDGFCLVIHISSPAPINNTCQISPVQNVLPSRILSFNRSQPPGHLTLVHIKIALRLEIKPFELI